VSKTRECVEVTKASIKIVIIVRRTIIDQISRNDLTIVRIFGDGIVKITTTRKIDELDTIETDPSTKACDVKITIETIPINSAIIEYPKILFRIICHRIISLPNQVRIMV
jgi:hypothetical protein